MAFNHISSQLSAQETLYQFLFKLAPLTCFICLLQASNINIYGAFLHNYGRATDTVRKCSASNAQFADLTRDIRLKSLSGGQSQSQSLEDLLHKPVARVQKNALVLHVSTKCLVRVYCWPYLLLKYCGVVCECKMFVHVYCFPYFLLSHIIRTKCISNILNFLIIPSFLNLCHVVAH